MTPSVLDLINSIGEKESSITKRLFVSPICSNNRVATSIAGIVYTFSIPSTKEGWYQIKPVSTKKAKIVGPAQMAEIETYLKIFDKIRIVLCMKKEGIYYGIPDKANKFGFTVNEPVPVFLCDDAPLDFDRIIARFDGSNFWYDRIDSSNDPVKADYLRQSMLKLVPPDKISFSGLTPEERHSYSLRMALDKKLVADQKKDIIKKDVEFAGAQLVNFTEKKDHYTVTYTVGAQSFTSHISKDPRHMIISAGLCLNGNDRNFDLKSLVTVIREAQRKRVVHIT